MTTFTEKVANITWKLQRLAEPNGLTTSDVEWAVKLFNEAHQAEISRVRKEEWEKLHTKHEVGDTVGHYEITDRFKKVGKNTKYRVICKLCGAPMFRYSNRFKTNHKDCPAINKIKGEYNG